LYRLALLLSVWLFAAAPAAAAPRHAGCTANEVKVIDDAIATAKELTLKAAVAVQDTSDYQRWFGGYSQSNAEQVRASLKSVVTALRGGAVTEQCHAATDEGCRRGEYAWVFANRPYLMHICPPFFNLPPLTALRPGDRRSDNGTREGTIVHEVSHFLHVADTEDHCYSRAECSRMAQNNPRLAIDNADSYQYFTEDVTYYARQPAGEKPAPAPRADR